ncbi:universal stress protein [Dactylosporangium aurantiacum]|uniref:Universal stress protein n=1 Tax=Dactylosporangium aurantiacum TaxID=35754 RepID=A0A9Q9MQU9_9ACTN|nr:universal stress protein [Dactylosporangium aurantiacum]MDG6105898.1 universal stress protein [Dactylosporangium aurantiacum]UWZ57927.1 universal stress protein [Dactylosporangium aurantiacum]
MNAQRIVVGYDGSDEARTAVDWAADEAARTGAQLQIVHGYHVAWPGIYYDVTAELIEAAERTGEQLVAEAVSRVRDRHDGIDVFGTAVQAPGATTLLDLGDSAASLLVVGCRGAGGVSNLLLGSVSQQVATHARTPVAVVRGHCDAAAGPVVVGVDGSPSAETALRLAFEAAAARGTEVVAVRAYVPPPATVVPRDAAEAAERAALESSLDGWRDRYPGVKLAAVVTAGRAAKVLIGMSHTAQLVVVGSRGHGGFTGLLLGSVGQQLMHYAECPVLIAHAPKSA